MQMFEMDAYVGVDVLGLAFMKGEQPHAGFPEVKYADMAESLARAGYRVVVVEQVRVCGSAVNTHWARKSGCSVCRHGGEPGACGVPCGGGGAGACA